MSPRSWYNRWNGDSTCKNKNVEKEKIQFVHLRLRFRRKEFESPSGTRGLNANFEV